MAVTLQRALRSIRRRAIYNLHPRAIHWKYLKKHAPDRGVITRLSNGLRVRVYPHDVIGAGIYVEGHSEVSTWHFIERYLEPGMTFFDLGANLGQYTLLGATCVGPKGSVHSFEPSERMYSELRFNVELNNLQSRCALNRVAVSDSCGTARLSKYTPGGEVFASIGTQHWAQGTHIVGHEDVATITLDDYVEKNVIGRVHLMKMDIEGAELLALRGGGGLFGRSDAPTIVLEVADVNTAGFGYRAVEIVRLLNEFGYLIHHLGENGHVGNPVGKHVDAFHGENLIAMKRQTDMAPASGEATR